MTYVLLIYRATEVGKKPPGMDERATLRAHERLQREAAARGDLHAVARLEESRNVRTVRRHANAHEVVDGPFIETKEWLVGFYLLALMILHDARRPARADASGAPVPLPDQDRARWDREAIAEGTALLDVALRAGAPGPFQIEAAISATHCRAKAAADTDWPEIAHLYALLERARPSPGARVNRAFAVARAHGAREGLALLDEGVTDYPYAHLVRGALLEELGHDEAAIAALERAAAHARNGHEARQIRDRIARARERARS